MVAPELYLFANVNLVPRKYDDWQSAYDHLAEYVWDKEPTTKTYYFGIPFDFAEDVSGATLMFAFEIYENRERLTETHLKSAAMAKFLERALPIMTTGLDLAYYTKVGGFLDSRGDRQECGIMHDTKIECVSPAARETVISELQAIARGLEADEGVYTYVICASMEEKTGLRVFARFQSKDDLERVSRTGNVLRFWKEFGQTKIATMQQRGYFPNKKGWLHRSKL
ncbi:uncharacterized protein JN550_011072 [Neoarthrinium moseri]|uniref:uncharacterized protein n=1 Tax=Neoarthrinium moseri TaxID=1658444 RepID=UPI001FDE3739|nr:uncharacterized protein JN550_011072 [Neoarthrinium moseri]KAI1861250.1 hypothetical protein JN550_011072 [Neoarthrinium moseri]